MPSSDFILKILNKNKANSPSLSQEFLNKCNRLLETYNKLTQKKDQLRRLKKINSPRSGKSMETVARDIQALVVAIKEMKKKNNLNHKEWKYHHESVINIIKDYSEREPAKEKEVNNKKIIDIQTKKRSHSGMFERNYESRKRDVLEKTKSAKISR